MFAPGSLLARARSRTSPRGLGRGLEGLREGTRAILHVPAAQAYGTAGWPGRVPPDMPLRYEIELLSVRAGER